MSYPSACNQTGGLKYKMLIFAFMKTICFILSFYFMALSIMPCHDREDFSNSGKSSISQSKNESPACQDESCPPLCHCTCCGTTFVINASTSVFFDKTEVVREHPVYCAQMPTSVPASIWQPPKIA